MTTERDDDDADPTTERQAPEAAEQPARRPRLMVVAVATAVLLAGGGGAYWAATASDGGDGAKASTAPLRLDGVPGQDSVNGDGSSSSEGNSQGNTGTGTAPAGGTYKLVGTLPKGPDSAPVYKGSAVDKADAQRLAALLGMSGPVADTGDAWRAGAGDGAGPTLLVSKQAPGSWSYSRYGAGTGGQPVDPVLPPQPIDPGGPVRKATPQQNPAGPGAEPMNAPMNAPMDTATGSPASPPAATQPVSEARAKAAAAPVLAGLGLSGAGIDASETTGAVRTVIADPVVGGLPTHGWSTGLEVASDGQITLAHGRLAALDKGEDYPVVSAAQALKQLNGHVMHPDHGIAACPRGPGSEPGAAPWEKSAPDAKPAPKTTPKPAATPSPTLPGQDKTLPHTLPCVPGNGHPLDVRGAVFGLALDYVSGVPALVPSWLFEVAQAGVTRSSTVAEPAVDPAYVQRDAPSATPPAPTSSPTPSNVKLTGYRTAGSTLTVSFYGGVCSTYHTAVAESAEQVRVAVTATETHPGKVCVMIAKRFTKTITLDGPLGDRKVVDTDGHPLAVG